MPGKNGQQAYCMIFNNYPKGHVKELQGLKNLAYIHWGYEIAPTTGTPHLQGYMEFITKRTMGSIQKEILKATGKACALKPASGDCKQNQVYCSKEYTRDPNAEVPYIEWGKPVLVGRGARTDLDIMREAVSKGNNMSQIIDIATSVQSIKCAEVLFKYKEKPRENMDVKVYWLYGPSGAGKTRYVYDKYPDVYRPINFKWWEGYDKHEVVLIDDFRKDWCSFDELLRLTDRYPFKVETKGGSRQALFKELYITTPYDVRTTFRHSDENLVQIERRVIQRNFIL